MRFFTGLLLIIFTVNTILIQEAAGTIVKGGELLTSETWSGEVTINSDVVIPQGMTLTIEPGTKFSYTGQPPRLFVNGTLKVGQGTTLEGKYDLVPLDQTTKIIRVSPYSVDTQSLRDEFRIFRTQYVILWTILSAGLIYAVATR